MSDVQLRIFAFCQAREVEGAPATIATVLATAEAIYQFLIECRGPLPTRH